MTEYLSTLFTHEMCINNRFPVNRNLMFATNPQMWWSCFIMVSHFFAVMWWVGGGGGSKTDGANTPLSHRLWNGYESEIKIMYLRKQINTVMSMPWCSEIWWNETRRWLKWRCSNAVCSNATQTGRSPEGEGACDVAELRRVATL